MKESKNVYEVMYQVYNNGELWLARKVQESMKSKERVVGKHIELLEEYLGVLLQVNGKVDGLDGYKGLGALTAIKNSKKYTKIERINLLMLNGKDLAKVQVLPTVTLQDKVKYLQELVDDVQVLAKEVNIRYLSELVEKVVTEVVDDRLNMVMIKYKKVESNLEEVKELVEMGLYVMDVIKQVEVEMYKESELMNVDTRGLDYEDRPKGTAWGLRNR